jgi:hypothetical protein
MSKEKNTSDNHKDHAPLAGVMGCAFIALADRYGAEQYHEFDSKEDALSFLEYGSDNGEHMDIAVIDCKTNKMVWYKGFLGKKECQNRVDLSIYHRLCSQMGFIACYRLPFINRIINF